MPFDLSGVHSATIRRRSDEKLAAQFDREAALDGVSAAVNSAFERRARARRMHTLAQAERRSAVAMLEGVRAERKVGERSTFDEIRAIENLTSAETSMNLAKYELQAAEYTLAAETGLIERLMAPPASLAIAQAEK
jgi:outer membrane protein